WLIETGGLEVAREGWGPLPGADRHRARLRLRGGHDQVDTGAVVERGGVHDEVVQAAVVGVAAVEVSHVRFAGTVGLLELTARGRLVDPLAQHGGDPRLD